MHIIDGILCELTRDDLEIIGDALIKWKGPWEPDEPLTDGEQEYQTQRWLRRDKLLDVIHSKLQQISHEKGQVHV